MENIFEQLLIKKSYDLMLQNKFMISLLFVRLRQKKSSSFLRGSRVPVILVAFTLWNVIEIARMMQLLSCILLSVLHSGA